MQRLECNQNFVLSVVYFIILGYVFYPNVAIPQYLKLNDVIALDEVSNRTIKNFGQDSYGFLWLASDANLWRFDGYELLSYKDVIKNKGSNELKGIRRLHSDRHGVLWVGTEHSGLFRINQNILKSFTTGTNVSNNISSNSVTYITNSLINSGVWVGTSNGLNFLSIDLEFTHYPFEKNLSIKDKYITSVLQVSEKTLLVGTKTALYSFDIGVQKYTKIALTNKKKDIRIFVIHKDERGVLWVGSNLGLFTNKEYVDEFIKYRPDIIRFPVTTITSTTNNIWIGSIDGGLFKISYDTDTEIITNFKSVLDTNSSLKKTTVVSLFADNSGALWVSTFYQGIFNVNTKTLNFGLQNNSKNSLSCLTSPVIFGFDVDKNDTLWLATMSGLIKFNEKNYQCTTFQKNINNEVFYQKAIQSIFHDSSDYLWMSTTNGLHKLNKSLGLIDTLNHKYQKLNINFIYEQMSHQLLLGTKDGLYQYNIENDNITKIAFTNNKLKNVKVYSYTLDANNNHYYATSVGVMKLTEPNKLSIDSKIQSQLPTTKIYSIHANKNGDLWIGTYQHGLFQFNSMGELLLHYTETDQVSSNTSILSMLIDNNKSLWLGTDNGLIKLNTETREVRTFYESDGLQGDYFNLNAAYKAPDGKLYFGGRNGFNAFYPGDIKLNTTPPNIVLTDFSRFGKSVEVGVEQDGFLLEADINQLDELVLSHKDYVVGFEFAALDYADPARNKYAYMLEGQDPQWIYTNADNRRISYSNLSAGTYTFRVKGANKDGIWNEQGKSLKVIVKPAPWFSWWAYAMYLLTVLGLLHWIINRKNKANQRINQMLKAEVAKQTKELQAQKQTVEELLAKKKELFANVSHEFRTPLTLILGPINKLLNSHLPLADINALKMVNRNANRLLTMVEQILQLAKVSDNNAITYYRIKTATHIQAIVASFQPLAQDKRIDLQLLDNEAAAISSTQDALEIILGNLLSNAIKYTQSGGKIRVSSTIIDNKVLIQVTDTGCGLDEQQQKDIFNRFKRLDSHHNIEGIGIGLSVVEDIVNINNAELSINSKPGEGSTFSVSFISIDLDFTEELEQQHDSLLIKQLASENTDLNTIANIQPTTNNQQKESIIIIDDNHDMRAHIAETIKDYYHCYLAAGGKAGIALAIKHVPDIIICDVMMPEMDGFHVARVLRSDSRTSHIPLMLLTALDDRESRIRGWREHVDVYLTKPFDAQELLLQLENILVIRNILKQQAGQKLKAGQSANNIDLPKRDQQFINKLNGLIAKNYQDPSYLRPQMASDMAVSQRQLQRKLKALIDKNPMDLLREYRLNQAGIMLKDGYQVSITSDECGFNSLPHFSKCFKSQFGLSPKAYQTACKK